MKTPLVPSVAVAVILCATGLRAESPRPGGVAGSVPQSKRPDSPTTTTASVEYAAPLLTLRVSQPTELQRVLESICTAVEARCEVAEGVHYTVPATEASGTWIEVATAILQASGLSYAVVPAGRSLPAHLIIENTLATASLAQFPRHPSVAQATPPGMTRGPGGVLTREPAEEPEEPAFAEPALDPAVAASMGLTSTGVPFPGPAGTAVFVTAPTEGTTTSAPFPDANGNVFLPTRAPADNGAGAAGPVSPFPDAFGNPIRPPAGTVARPFATPFPDGHGGSISMPPPPPVAPADGH